MGWAERSAGSIQIEKQQRAYFMRIFVTAIILLCIGDYASAQKKPLDFRAGDHWPYLEPRAFSNDGKYVAYEIHSELTRSVYAIQSTEQRWKMELAGIKNLEFTADSRWLIFMNSNDSLGLLNLEKDSVRYIAGIQSFKLSGASGSNWLAFSRKKPAGELDLTNLLTGQEKKYEQVEEYIFNDVGTVLLLEVGANEADKVGALLWVDLLKGAVSAISHNFRTDGFTFDEKGDRLAFFASESNNDEYGYTLKFYKPGMDSAVTIVDATTEGMEGWVGDRKGLLFDKGGDELFFSIKKVGPDRFAGTTSTGETAGLTIRNYKDNQFSDRLGKTGWAVIRLSGGSSAAIVLAQGEDLEIGRLTLEEAGKYVLVESLPAQKPDVYIGQDHYRKDFFLVSTQDGTRKLLKSNAILRDVSFSVGGKYVIWYDGERRQWSVFNIINDRVKIITGQIEEPLYASLDNPRELSTGLGLAGWLKNDTAVLINGRYNIWRVDPRGVEAPINLTGGLSPQRQIQFRYLAFTSVPAYLPDTMILSAFDVVTKDNGFFRLSMGRTNFLQKLTMGRAAYYYPERYTMDIEGVTDLIKPWKAEGANAWLVERTDCDQYPNLYVTKDFTRFVPVTNLAPQQAYWWYTSELIHFTLPNGAQSEGILYKPENFDSQKKYPVVFYYYAKNADALHLIVHPDLSDGRLTIPWYVSNGYLVCVPDMVYYKPGYPGESALRSVEAAANVLSSMPWVDPLSMGVDGHSFGGWETNYMVTHTRQFRAAVTASGFSDEVSQNLWSSRNMWYFESEQGLIGASLWKQPGLYIANSPVFAADSISTPLLMMHTTNDRIVSLVQGQELYNALVHFGKKAWFLQYDNEDHLLENEPHRLDYSIRVAQFFDYYLKGALPPKWMTGSNTTRRNVSGYTGLELDSTGGKP
jgi:dipeptidyl aminopeptidase/acylaminoacyl peptidase